MLKFAVLLKTGLCGSSVRVGELQPGAEGFFKSNCSTADADFPIFTADLDSKSFLKSIRLVFGVPIRSEQVCGISTESLAQLCLPLGCCCIESSMVLGVDRPELLGLLPWERTPSWSFNLFLSSSLSFGFVAGDPITRLLSPPVGVDVNKEASLVSMIFLGLMGEIGSVIDSFAKDELMELVCDRKNVENPDPGVLGVLVSLFGVEYKSSMLALGVVVVVFVVVDALGAGRFFSCSVQ